jgi:hypothetical protein
MGFETRVMAVDPSALATNTRTVNLLQNLLLLLPPPRLFSPSISRP